MLTWPLKLRCFKITTIFVSLLSSIFMHNRPNYAIYHHNNIWNTIQMPDCCLQSGTGVRVWIYIITLMWLYSACYSHNSSYPNDVITRNRFHRSHVGCYVNYGIATRVVPALTGGITSTGDLRCFDGPISESNYRKNNLDILCFLH